MPAKKSSGLAGLKHSKLNFADMKKRKQASTSTTAKTGNSINSSAMMSGALEEQ